MMSFLDAVKTCYEKSFIIEGRASRSEYWWFQILIPAAFILSVIIDPDGEILLLPVVFFGVISLPANLCVIIRRWHDLGKSGWYSLLLLIPVWGWIPTVVYFCMEGVKVDNTKRPVVFDPERSILYKEKTTSSVVENAEPALSPPVAPVQQTVYQNIYQGDHVTKTEVKDSVLNRSNLGEGTSKMQELEKLTEMKDKGIIDYDEFKQMKKEILGK